MKSKILSAVLIVLMAAFANGCRDYKTKTKINSDGTCERTVVVSGDSSEVANPASLPFPIPVDASWNIEKRKDTSEKNKFYYSATKKFNDVNLLSDEYRNKEKFGIDIAFSKSFRWFYSYFTYEETYKAFFPFRLIPLKSFLTPDEYEKYLADDTTKTLRKRLDDFASENYIEYFFNVISSAAEKHSLKDLSKEKLLSKKDYFKNNIDKEGNDKSSLINFLEKTFGVKSIREIKPEIELAYDEITVQMELISKGDGSYENEVAMPGIILNTNSKSIVGNAVSWKVDSKRFCFEDFSMQVESRVVNVWAFVVSAIIVLAAVVLLVLPRFKKR
jgi:hypothetical protein